MKIHGLEFEIKVLYQWKKGIFETHLSKQNRVSRETGSKEREEEEETKRFVLSFHASKEEMIVYV